MCREDVQKRSELQFRERRIYRIRREEGKEELYIYTFMNIESIHLNIIMNILMNISSICHEIRMNSIGILIFLSFCGK